YVRAEGAGLAFRDWPLMSGRLVPDLTKPGAGPMFAHRLLAIGVTALIAWCMVRARTMRPRSAKLVALSTFALVLVLMQIADGAPPDPGGRRAAACLARARDPRRRDARRRLRQRVQHVPRPGHRPGDAPHAAASPPTTRGRAGGRAPFRLRLGCRGVHVPGTH